MPPGLRNWIVKAPKAIDEKITPIEPLPDLESTVVVPHPGGFFNIRLPSMGFGLRADIPQKPSQV
ncbi:MULTISPECIES: hypothetical protein [Prochlorococcus]|uniref:hypothetical protein n=1 Tax=Prochlorococcus TaxID=1218 RepID=UPI0007B33717|nr:MULTISPECIES: hypothetical protein [Prochlorococcus]NMP05028.1 hypothetical protein [Prochlorococcus sp. P1361]